MDEILNRVKKFNVINDIGVDNPEDILRELILLVNDRLAIRIGEENVPKVFDSIIVAVVIKLVRKLYHEGIASERIGENQVTFLEDVLSEYDKEINTYIANKTEKGKVRFL